MLTFTPPTLLIGIYFRAESFNILWNDDEILYNTSTRDLWKLKFSVKKCMLQPGIESDIYCLECNNANLYTTDAVDRNLFCAQKVLIFSGTMMKFYIIPPLVTYENSNFLLKNICFCRESNPDLLFVCNNANLYTTDAVNNTLFCRRKF